jgi:hypothetical protein
MPHTAATETGAEDGGTARPVRSHGSGGGPLERVTVNLIPRSSRALEIATELTGDTKTDTINRALQIYAFLQQAAAQGASLYVRSSDAAAEPERVHLL